MQPANKLRIKWCAVWSTNVYTEDSNENSTEILLALALTQRDLHSFSMDHSHPNPRLFHAPDWREDCVVLWESHWVLHAPQWGESVIFFSHSAKPRLWHRLGKCLCSMNQDLVEKEMVMIEGTDIPNQKLLRKGRSGNDRSWLHSRWPKKNETWCLMASGLGNSVLQAGKAVAFGEAFSTCPNPIGWIWYAISGFKDFYLLPLIQQKCPSISKDVIETT